MNYEKITMIYLFLFILLNFGIKAMEAPSEQEESVYTIDGAIEQWARGQTEHIPEKIESWPAMHKALEHSGIIQQIGEGTSQVLRYDREQCWYKKIDRMNYFRLTKAGPAYQIICSADELLVVDSEGIRQKLTETKTHNAKGDVMSGYLIENDEEGEKKETNGWENGLFKAHTLALIKNKLAEIGLKDTGNNLSNENYDQWEKSNQLFSNLIHLGLHAINSERIIDDCSGNFQSVFDNVKGRSNRLDKLDLFQLLMAQKKKAQSQIRSRLSWQWWGLSAAFLCCATYSVVRQPGVLNKIFGSVVASLGIYSGFKTTIAYCQKQKESADEKCLDEIRLKIGKLTSENLSA